MKLPQLSLRDLFWLVALVAMGCGWWVEHRRLSDQIEALRPKQLISLPTILPYGGNQAP
jgi:hypothetical protein